MLVVVFPVAVVMVLVLPVAAAVLTVAAVVQALIARGKGSKSWSLLLKLKREFS